MRWLGVAVLFLAACGAAPSGEDLGTSRSAVIGGKDSDASQDAVVFLIHKDPSSPRVGQCTGTLVAPNVVLTARHCVAEADESADCAADGTAIRGGDVVKNHEPSTLLVYAGKDRPPFKTQKDPAPATVGARIVDDGATNLCNHDLALVVLKDPIPNVPVAPMRLSASPRVTKGETFTAVGWGITTTTTTPQVRQQRAGVAIVAVGPDTSLEMPVPPNQFAVRESICLGDSGGPALDASGTVIGVVSGGGNGQMPTASNPSASCVGSAALNLYTELAPFEAIIGQALTLAGAEPATSTSPTEPSEPGEPSTTPEPSAPTTTTTTTGGCASSPARPGGAPLLALLALARLAQRRRARARRVVADM